MYVVNLTWVEEIKNVKFSMTEYGFGAKTCLGY